MALKTQISSMILYSAAMIAVVERSRDAREKISSDISGWEPSAASVLQSNTKRGVRF